MNDRLHNYVRTFMMATGAYTLEQINERASGLAEEIRSIVADEQRVDKAKACACDVNGRVPDDPRYLGPAQRTDYPRSTTNRPAWDLVEAWLVKHGLRDHAGTVQHEELANQITVLQSDDRGRLINECATLGARLVQLHAELPEIEKQARKTPRKDMHEERAKVEAAKRRIEPLRADIIQVKRQLAAVRERLIQLGHLPCQDCNGALGRYVPHPQAEGAYVDLWVPCPTCATDACSAKASSNG